MKKKYLFLWILLLSSCVNNYTSIILVQSFNVPKEEIKIINKADLTINKNSYCIDNVFSIDPIVTGTTYNYSFVLNEKGNCEKIDDDIYYVEVTHCSYKLNINYLDDEKDVVNESIKEFVLSLDKEKVDILFENQNDNILRNAAYKLIDLTEENIEKLIEGEEVSLSINETNKYLYASSEEYICKYLEGVY